MEDRFFPVVVAERVDETAGFYERFGFTRHAQLPKDGEPTYVGLRRGSAELAVVDTGWPGRQYGGDGAGRTELFVHVADVDATLKELRAASVAVLREPVDMPWGERIGYVADPAGNPVAIASRVP
ncbi:VOC family protein [Actinomadura macrotermitis]|uniref:VOC domain-containing protein n=1 Tax=Actinomadura macrotermitis TaxID=2585200 RepID=A0A7K0C0Y6_9ACTN|nr:VOC family protein [Actinomadura macrotermitis]MQY06464.1 hypothetical protein [Actinomadura macrotermitis]